MDTDEKRDPGQYKIWWDTGSKRQKASGLSGTHRLYRTTIDPMKIFISRKMTRVLDAVNTGNGVLLSNMREIPESSLVEAEKVLESIMDLGSGA